MKAIYFLDDESLYVKDARGHIFGVNLEQRQLSLLEETFEHFAASGTKYVCFSQLSLSAKLAKKRGPSTERGSLTRAKTVPPKKQVRKAVTQVTSPKSLVGKSKVCSTLTTIRSVTKPSAPQQSKTTNKKASTARLSRSTKSLHKRAETSVVARFDDVRSSTFVVAPSINNGRVHSLASENMDLQRRLNEQSPSLHSRRGSLTSLSCKAKAICENFSSATG